MNINEIQQQILDYDEFIVSEIRRIQELYKLKNEIRWAQTRADENLTESVAEHIFGMHVVADYFLPLEDPEGKLDHSRIHQMITWHDIDEVEIGDIISTQKTEQQINDERQIAQQVIDRMPEHMRRNIEKLMDEYTTRTTLEAKFVKAIDKAEPVFELYREEFSRVLKSIKRKSSEWDDIITKHTKDFRYIKRFTDVVHKQATEKGYFYAEE